MIHRLIPHKLLALDYNNKEKLQNHPELKKFFEWVKFQTKKVKFVFGVSALVMVLEMKKTIKFLEEEVEELKKK
jgi:hypothetical protein